MKYNRDNPDLELQTRRFVDILVKCYGREKMWKNPDFFMSLLTRFHQTFDTQKKSEGCHWKPFLAFKQLLCMCSSVGGHCPKQCGKAHADLFGNDGCTFNNALTQDEKDEHKVKLDKYLQLKNSKDKEEKDKAVKPQTMLNEA